MSLFPLHLICAVVVVGGGVAIISVVAVVIVVGGGVSLPSICVVVVVVVVVVGVVIISVVVVKVGVVISVVVVVGGGGGGSGGGGVCLCDYLRLSASVYVSVCVYLCERVFFSCLWVPHVIARVRVCIFGIWKIFRFFIPNFFFFFLDKIRSD